MKFIFFKIIITNKRLCCIFFCICLIFIFLGIKLIDLQILSSNLLINKGDSQSLRIQNIQELRGIITDRMGRLLAINIPVDAICIDPKIINEFGGINANISQWIQLSNTLNIPLEKLFFFVKNHSTERFLYLSRQVNPIISNYISELKIPGVYLQHGTKRYYPAGDVCAHLVGITNIDNKGIEGIEKSFDSWLSGYAKTKIIRQNRLGKIIEDVSVLNQGLDAKNIILSIDERLQYFAYHELNKAISINKARSGSIVLIDINTGEVLAMVNSPSYDPNNIVISDKSVMRNRAITDSFEPGSTIKPIVVLAALKYKIINKDSILNTAPYTICGHQVKDVVPYDKLTISEILRKSSNVGVSKLALAMPRSALINSCLSFGIGKLTNIGLIGENKGKLYSYNRYYSDIEKITLSYGYGLMITPLQLAKIYAVIGGMGVTCPLSIIKIENPLSIKYSEHQFFSKSLIRTVLDMMEVTELSNSGCYRAAIKGYRIAVKTGTIKQVGSNGKYINKYIACAAGVAPASNPKFALVVIINDPTNGMYYGGLVSAPVFKSVMSYALQVMNISPDFLHK